MTNAFVRIGNKATLNAQVEAAKAIGATVEKSDFRTSVRLNGETLFQAYKKNPQMYIFRYNGNLISPN